MGKHPVLNGIFTTLALSIGALLFFGYMNDSGVTVVPTKETPFPKVVYRSQSIPPQSPPTAIPTNTVPTPRPISDYDSQDDRKAAPWPTATPVMTMSIGGVVPTEEPTRDYLAEIRRARDGTISSNPTPTVPEKVEEEKPDTWKEMLRAASQRATEEKLRSLSPSVIGLASSENLLYPRRKHDGKFRSIYFDRSERPPSQAELYQREIAARFMEADRQQMRYLQSIHDSQPVSPIIYHEIYLETETQWMIRW